MSDGHLISHEDSQLSPLIYDNIEKEYKISFSIFRIFSATGSCKKTKQKNPPKL